jgi:hypothetical protein
MITLRHRLAIAVIALQLAPARSLAGPPFQTDDPETVEHRHWELYLASAHEYDPDGWSGTAPHLEVNYGVAPNTQLHLIVPLAYSAPNGSRAAYGFGDLEVGMKLRLVQEGKYVPQIGVFPLVELPTGSEGRGLGAGSTRIFFPLWLQKSIGKWTAYGGGGFWFNPGRGKRHYGFFGLLVQRHVLDWLTVGAELFHTTPSDDASGDETRFNVGAIVDFNENHHLLVSAGRALQGPNLFQGYLAYQLTLGPREEKEDKEK